jgi:ribonucleotide reductase alpha subunit
MIKTIIKRNGSKEAFSAEKLNGWSQWAAEKLGKVVDWTEVVLNTVSTLPEECTSKLLQETLIQYCLGKNVWEYNLMAGKLYSSLIVREVHGSDKYPTVKEVHENLYKDGLMRKLDYSDAEYAAIEKMIDHSLNAKYPHYALHQNRRKYSLQNKVNKKEYETSQHMYMRMAMAAAEYEPKETRLQDVKEYYWTFSKHKANVPTPFYVNLGTYLNGYASCCVFTTKDTAQSLAAADHITYMMTVMSAGIGYHIKTRSISDPVRGGLMPHQGKLPYLTAYVGALGANLQNGRGGAGTAYMNFYDPEIEVLTKLKNPMTPLAKQIRGSDYSFGSNRLIVKKVAAGEDVALFSYYDAPELYEAIYSGDQDYFEELYEEFLKSDKPRRMISARQIVLSALSESFETGRIYEHFTDLLNGHTPFKDKIYSGNLCITGDTLIEFVDEEGDEYKVSVKNFIDNFYGKRNYYARSMDFDYKKECYSLIEDAGVTAYTDVLYHIKTDNGVISCTPDHLIYVVAKGYIAAKNIVNGDDLLINAKETTKVTEVKVEILEEKTEVYDIKVLKNECFFANGILVHNCVEIALPTAGFNSVKELYEPYDESKNFIKFLSTTDKEYNVYSWEYVTTQRGHMNVKDIRIGDEFVYHDQNVKVKKIIERSTSPEIALCNIGGIIVSNIENDDEYKRVAYRVLKLIRYGIHHSEYIFKNLEDTAKARMNAGVGIVGLAHLLAKKGLKYSSQEGKNFIHEIAETHYWHLANAALELSKEFGNAPWMYKTKWPEGWLPIDTYCKSVDNIVTVENKRDWESLRAKIIANGGIAFSVLAAMMPSESCCNFKTLIKVLNEDKEAFEIEMEDGQIIVLDEDSSVLVLQEDGHTEWKYVKDIEEGDDIIQFE